MTHSEESNDVLVILFGIRNCSYLSASFSKQG